jgi:hypothetical protein
MKIFITTILLFTLSFNGFSECIDRYMSVWPQTKEIKQNSIFMIQGRGYNDLIKGLNTKYPIYLKTGDKIIKLKVIQICMGQSLSESQVILKPDEDLKENQKYVIVVEKFFKVDNTIKNEVLGNWTVIKDKDLTSPKLIGTPNELKKWSKQYGCGSEVIVQFGCIVSDMSSCLVRTELKNIKTNVVSVYYLTPNNNIINVAHTMCGGSFLLDYNADYEITFSLMDASGNESIKKTNARKFKSPLSPREGNRG